MIARCFCKPNFNVEKNSHGLSISILNQKVKFVQHKLAFTHLRNIIAQVFSKMVIFCPECTQSYFTIEYLVFQLVTGFKN